MDSWFAGTAERPPGRHSQLFVHAADTGSTSNTPLLSSQSSIWTTHTIMYLQAVAVPLAFWFKPVCVCLALSWLCFRAYHVLHKPLEELASLLGFDIPLTPSVALADIKADGAIIHWSLPEKQKQKTSFKYEIHLNGALIDTVPAHESAVTISGLQTASFYIVRVALVSHLEFSSKSAPVRFRTKPASSADFFHHTSDGHETDHDGTQEPLLRVKSYRGLKDVTPASADDTTIPGLTREGSSVMGRGRSNTGRRVSPALIHDSEVKDNAGTVEGAGTVQQLTETLDTLRREQEEADRSAKEEEDEEIRLKEELIRERDELRAEVAEKEKASRNLKREVNIMERQNTAAQNDRTKAERMLQQKIQERQKLGEDTLRWAKEIEEFKLDAEKIKQEQVDTALKAEQDKVELRQQIADKMATIKTLEDDIKETTTEIRKVERSGKSPSPNGAEQHMSLVEQLQHDAEEDRQWKVRTYELQSQYTMAVQRLDQAQRFYYSNLQYLESMREKRRQDEAAVPSRELTSPSNGSERLPSRRDSQKSRRGNSGHNANESPRANPFAPAQSAFGNGSTTFTSAPLFAFNAITGNAGLEIPEDDRDRLTGGALMSPGAGEGLLPADLFTSEDKAINVLPLPGLGALPGLLPGLGQQMNHEPADQGPASPISINSRPASTFASPQASQQNLHHHLNSPEALIDSDRRSVRSNRSGRAPSGTNTGSRFSAMFGIRARAKNSSLDSPMSGVPLGKTHSHSMPRQDQGLPGLDSATRKRNSSLSGTMLDDEAPVDGSPDAQAQVRKRPFNLNPFNRDKTTDGWPSSFSPFGRKPTSPRPGSTHSGELPRPSFDSSRWGVDAWPSTDSGNGARASPLSLGGWNAPVNSSRTFLSRQPSRSTSVQYGGSGPPANILEDEADVLDPDLEPHLAPIGTKPADMDAADKQADNKLNPAAKDFKSFFSIGRNKNKAEGSSSRTSTPQATGKDSVDDESPPQSRKSRDARSLLTLESSNAESRRPSNELVLSPTYSNSEVAYSPQVGTGSLGKESFMQKITRKSSSSKFSLPTFKREKSRFDRDASVGSPSAPPVEDEEDAMSASVGSLKERESSEKSRANARSWSNVLKIGKKRAGGETPSISELSTASETTGDDGNDDT
ncbi:hypothetical protein AMS68_002610 [Peltaster fructicola]|uniref:Fibronectin type-III domain-containing protein n=1 Tax=Peltaster fructicola TaxID=286661 RepID=A0A6H0XQV8_9PEZI|nr:hypothetical protein AMS68_002610 [Peltaster fructicola]